MPPNKTMPPIFRIHNFATGKVICHVMQDRPFILLGPPDCATGLGAGWLGELVLALRTEFPQSRFAVMIDCADHAGAALTAIDRGLEHILIRDISSQAHDRLVDLAGQKNITIWNALPDDPPIHDIGNPFLPPDEMERRLRQILTE